VKNKWDLQQVGHKNLVKSGFAKELFDVLFYKDIPTAQKAHRNHSRIYVHGDVLLGSKVINNTGLDFIIKKSDRFDESPTGNHQNWIKVNGVDIQLLPYGGPVDRSSRITPASFIRTDFVNVRMNELVSKKLDYVQKDKFDEVDATAKIGPTYGYDKYMQEMELLAEQPEPVLHELHVLDNETRTQKRFRKKKNALLRKKHSKKLDAWNHAKGT
jgi:hypothetical protein